MQKICQRGRNVTIKFCNVYHLEKKPQTQSLDQSNLCMENEPSHKYIGLLIFEKTTMLHAAS